MKIRNKKTGRVFEVMDGTLYPDFFEEVKEQVKPNEDDKIIIGEPKIEYVVEETQAEQEKKIKSNKKAKKAKKTTKKGKKNDSSK